MTTSADFIACKMKSLNSFEMGRCSLCYSSISTHIHFRVKMYLSAVFMGDMFGKHKNVYFDGGRGRVVSRLSACLSDLCRARLH